jgi:ketosteroid isomerase-like protein
MQDAEKLIRFGLEWDEAIVSNDVEKIAPFMADDWVIIGSNGITSKTEFLGWIESGALTHHTMTTEEPRTRIYGNSGFVSSRGISAGTWHGEHFELHEWQTSVYTKEQNGWKCVLTMLTPAEKK